jgi:hypothetical protein
MDKLRWLMTAAAAFVVTVLHDGSNHNAAILAAVTAYTKRNLSVVVESGGRMRWAVRLCVGCAVWFINLKREKVVVVTGLIRIETSHFTQSQSQLCFFLLCTCLIFSALALIFIALGLLESSDRTWCNRQ